MVHSDEDLVSLSEDLDAASKPPVRANEPPIRANEPPTKVPEPQSDEAVKRPNAPNVSGDGGDLYDPDSQHPSWEPNGDFTALLEKHFRRKLSYDQVSDILDGYSIPSVDSLFSPTLDTSVLSQISPLKSRKYTQERDKELASVQRSMLNITGPLCCLHDALCSDQDVSKDDIKSILEQSLCLLGSANFQFSALRRKKILMAINKDKIGLADQPLRNAKRMLFGDDFPSIASKQVDLSRGLAKNLVQLPGLLSTHAQGHRVLLTRRSPLLAPTLSTTTVQKTGFPFVPPNRRQKNRLIHRQLEGNNLRPRHPQYCFRLQNPVALQTSSIYHSSYKSQPRKCRSHRFRGGTFRPVIDLSFLNKFVENSHFQMERRLYDHPGSERRLFVSPSPQGLSKVPSVPLEKQMLRLQKPLFWLKYCTKDLHQTFKTRSSISLQMGCPYDPLSGQLSNLGVDLPGGTESHSYGCIPPGKPRLHCQSGKVMSDSDPNNNIPGLCNRLHCRSTKPSTRKL